MKLANEIETAIFDYIDTFDLSAKDIIKLGALPSTKFQVAMENTFGIDSCVNDGNFTPQVTHSDFYSLFLDKLVPFAIYHLTNGKVPCLDSYKEMVNYFLTNAHFTPDIRNGTSGLYTIGLVAYNNSVWNENNFFEVIEEWWAYHRVHFKAL